jgi:hypothetical protein
LVFEVARERELEEITAHIVEVGDDLGDLYGELVEIEQESVLTDEEILDRFEQLAASVPSRESLLAPVGGNPMAGF